MPRETTVLEARRRLLAGHHTRPPREAPPRPPLRVVDVALLDGGRRGGVRTYLNRSGQAVASAPARLDAPGA